MATDSADGTSGAADLRSGDLYLDRRSGEDRREKHSLPYFSDGGKDRRYRGERRKRQERRKGYMRITSWTSVGPLAEDE